jgi:hypothetical protein
VECGAVLRPIGRTPGGGTAPERGCPACLVKQYKEQMKIAQELVNDDEEIGSDDTETK